jgi:hypothetical protein
MKRVRGALVCALLVAAAVAAPARSATPVPGGANQVSAVSGKLGDVVFNGVLRVSVTGLAETTAPADLAEVNVIAGKKVMTFTALLRNGTKDEFTDLVTYSLADKDDVSVDVPSSQMHPGNLHILQGAATRQKAIFVVDKDFTPVKMIVQCATCGAHSSFRAIRFTIPAK